MVNSLSIFSSWLYSSSASIPEVEERRVDPPETSLFVPEGFSGTGARDDCLWAGGGRSRIIHDTACPGTGPSDGDWSSASGTFAAASGDGDGEFLKKASEGVSGSGARRLPPPPLDGMGNAGV